MLAVNPPNVYKSHTAKDEISPQYLNHTEALYKCELNSINKLFQVNE